MTDKYNLPTATTSTSSSPYQDSTLPPTYVIYDENGNPIKTIALDPTTNRGSYTMTAGEAGGYSYSGQYTGGNGYAPTGKTYFNTAVGGSSKARASVVTQAVAGPGIYLSNPDGRGVVTISLEPFEDPTKDPLYDIAFAKTERMRPHNPSDNTTRKKFSNTKGYFYSVGSNSVVKRSTNGTGWSRVALESDFASLNGLTVRLSDFETGNPKENLQVIGLSSIPGQVYVGTSTGFSNAISLVYTNGATQNISMTETLISSDFYTNSGVEPGGGGPTTSEIWDFGNLRPVGIGGNSITGNYDLAGTSWSLNNLANIEMRYTLYNNNTDEGAWVGGANPNGYPIIKTTITRLGSTDPAIVADIGGLINGYTFNFQNPVLPGPRKDNVSSTIVFPFNPTNPASDIRRFADSFGLNGSGDKWPLVVGVYEVVCEIWDMEGFGDEDGAFLGVYPTDPPTRILTTSFTIGP